METNEQWKDKGDCARCRRANYCTKDCTPRKNRKMDIIRQAYAKVLKEQLEKEPAQNEI